VGSVVVPRRAAGTCWSRLWLEERVLLPLVGCALLQGFPPALSDFYLLAGEGLLASAWFIGKGREFMSSNGLE